MRMVLDTNVLIDSTHDELSAAAKLLAAAEAGEFTALATIATQREYRALARRLRREPLLAARIEDFIAATELVTAAPVEVALDDPEDYKFLQAAVGGEADILVTSDRHLLDVGEVGRTRILKPVEAWAAFQEASENDSEWHTWAHGLGIGDSK